jgi:DNA mismatch repair protein MutS
MPRKITFLAGGFPFGASYRVGLFWIFQQGNSGSVIFRISGFLKRSWQPWIFREIMVPQGSGKEDFLKTFAGRENSCRLDEFPDEYFDRESALGLLQDYIRKRTWKIGG